MFNEIGKKIKGVASAVCWIQVAIYAIVGIIIMATTEELVIVGLLIIVVGGLFAWLSSITLYGFGELIDKVCSIEKTVNAEKYQKQSSNNFSAETVDRNNVSKNNVSHKFLGKCEMCNAENIMVCDAKIVDDMGVRYRKVCDNCFEKYNCQEK